MASASDSLFNRILWNQGAFGGNIAGLDGQTVGGLIYAALRKAAVTLGPGRTPSPAQMKDAIDELRRLTGSLNCDRLFIYAIDAGAYPLSESKTAYTIGQDPTGTLIVDIDAPRPQLLEEATWLDGSGCRVPLMVATSQIWANRIYQDPNTAGYPSMIYNDRAFPVSTLFFDVAPTGGSQIELWTWHQVPTYTNESDFVVFPLQYEDALVLNLACRLAPHFQREVHPDVRDQARLSLMRLESINAPQPIADLKCLGTSCDCGAYNIYTDEYKP